ncbi:uncharacterized protein DNG_02838 [Cephalotrichum gorgonifer]|uniref:AB hydrolase-1 domain-containing protein n=1 Tax=Cephalotrichum gorgonifer TaxID=2041049 RepID=A0AAE8MTW3_9PEZI|nr:uncharacterized protein DNG_02838 [Cephalotrichum gorgonifer]
MRPSFVFVTGACYGPAYFDPIRHALNGLGYSSVAVTPRALNSVPPATSFQPDADAVRDDTLGLLEKGEDVIIVMHSYGGIPGTEAAGDIIASRPDIAGRIKRLVYVAAFVPAEGDSLTSLASAAPPPAPDSVFYYSDDGYIVLNDKAEEAIFHDVPEPDRSTYAALAGKEPIGTNTAPVTHTAWEHIPSSYVYTTLDRIIQFQDQEFMVERARAHSQPCFPGKGGKPPRKPFSGPLGLFTLEAGHMPMLSKIPELAGILGQLAEE